jgi:hypothetical protein
MEQNRRTILKGAGAIAAMAATGQFAGGTETASNKERKRGMAHGLTLLTMRVQGEYRLGVKTERGVLDVPEAAKLLKMHAPATMPSIWILYFPTIGSRIL